MALAGAVLSTLAILGLTRLACRDAGDPSVLQQEALLNAEYRLPVDAGALVRVRDGEWVQEDIEDRQRLSVMDQGLRGDLDGDGLPDAVVLLVYSGGGSGVFHSLAAVLNEQGRLRHASSIALGDRIQVKSLSMNGARVAARLVVHGQGDAMCCPTQLVFREFGLEQGRLVEVYGP